MAVSRELSNMVREPVAGATFLCSLRTNRVSVMVSTLISSIGKGGADSAIVRDLACSCSESIRGVQSTGWVVASACQAAREARRHRCGGKGSTMHFAKVL